MYEPVSAGAIIFLLLIVGLRNTFQFVSLLALMAYVFGDRLNIVLSISYGDNRTTFNPCNNSGRCPVLSIIDTQSDSDNDSDIGESDNNDDSDDSDYDYDDDSDSDIASDIGKSDNNDDSDDSDYDYDDESDSDIASDIDDGDDMAIRLLTNTPKMNYTVNEKNQKPTTSNVKQSSMGYIASSETDLSIGCGTENKSVYYPPNYIVETNGQKYDTGYNTTILHLLRGSSTIPSFLSVREIMNANIYMNGEQIFNPETKIDVGELKVVVDTATDIVFNITLKE